MLPLLRPQAGRWCALGLLTGIGAALTVVGPLVVRSIVDRAVDGTDAATIRRLAPVAFERADEVIRLEHGRRIG